MSRVRGTVKWFSNEKGYGFIEREDAEDVFVHHSDIQGEGFKTLQAGEPVEFEVLPADKGPKAQQVVRLREEGAPVGAGESEEGEPARETGDAAPGQTLAEQLKEKIGRRFFGGG